MGIIIRGRWVALIGAALLLGRFTAQAAPAGGEDAKIKYYQNMRAVGQYKVCQSNLKNIGTALEMWSTDHAETYPESLARLTPDYLIRIPTCPAADRDTYGGAYRRTAKGYAVLCAGSSHAAAGVAANLPAYDSERGLKAPASPYQNATPPPGTPAVVVPRLTLMACRSNLKNIGTALEMWSVDHHGQYPTSLPQLKPDYFKQIPTCPSVNRDTYSAAYTMTRNPDTYAVGCKGSNHTSEGAPPNFPRYTSTQGLIER